MTPYGKPLPLSELKKDKHYYCVLAERSILITSIEEIQFVSTDTNIYTVLDVKGVMWTGDSYNVNVPISDNQLKKIKEENYG